MKRTITIVVVLLLCVGFGYWLFKISPQQSTPSQYTLDTSGAKPLKDMPAFNPAADHYQGNPGSKNVFVEYGDLECPHCAEYNPIVKQFVADMPDTVFVFRDYPLEQIHPLAVEAALAAEAAGAQGKYFQMHDILFEKQSEWQDLKDPLDKFAQYAQSIGVSGINQFKNDITSQKYKSVIEKSNDEALGLGLQGTPTFYYNGHQLQLSDLAGLKTQAQQFVNK